jgi:hypothetical protein
MINSRPSEGKRNMSLAEVVKEVLEYLRVVISWPVLIAFSLLLLRRQLCSLLDRIKKVDAFGQSFEFFDIGRYQANEAKPSPADQAAIEMSVSSGAYSRDYRALFVVVGLSNRTNQQDQVIQWRLTFESLNLELEPTSAPPNLVGGVPWWSSPMVKLPPNEFIQGSLYFRGTGPLAEGLPTEPLRGTVAVETLHGKQLSQPVRVYWLATLQARAGPK